MITLIVKNLHTGKSIKYELERMYDFGKLAIDFGPTINHIISGLHSVRAAADRIAEYLSSHHLNVEVFDPEDDEEIYDINTYILPKTPSAPKKSIDLKDVLESYEEVEQVDMPEHHILDAATHRWDKE